MLKIRDKIQKKINLFLVTASLAANFGYNSVCSPSPGTLWYVQYSAGRMQQVTS